MKYILALNIMLIMLCSIPIKAEQLDKTQQIEINYPQPYDYKTNKGEFLVRANLKLPNKGKVSAIKQENIQNYLSWIQGRLVFKDMRFDKVIRQLDNIYGIHSRLEDSSLATFNLTAYTNNTSLNEVLGMIALSLDIAYRKEGQKVVWREKRTQPTPQSKNIADTTVTKN